MINEEFNLDNYRDETEDEIVARKWQEEHDAMEECRRDFGWES